ncbi:MAG: YdiU family protein [Ideonella sp.]|nr:YdiU family protein [Ideonella sp.]MCC7458123.1 YdiU family protein [Nitrospira sp.]
MDAPLREPIARRAPAEPRWRAAGLLRSLGPAYWTALPAQPLPEVHWVCRNQALAAELGLGDWLHGDAALVLLAGNAPPAGPPPLASVYSGHQFGLWAGQLGDGRALLLGEIDSPLGPQEVQLKGSGLTPYSRMGDGRAVLRSSIREFLCSEAMHALGIPTTRALAVVGSPQPVLRETVETAAVVTRVAPSFLRFGHFEHFTHTAGDTVALRRLVDAVIDRYFPECRDAPAPLLAWLETVTRRTARLLAQWQAVGFCHGVMNTDNLSILGLTIDYGPFGFIDGFDPMHVCNHSDHQGRYAYARQPGVAWWNLHALVSAIAPLLDHLPEPAAAEQLAGAIAPFEDEFDRTLQARLRAKLGLATTREDDPALIDDLLRLMATERTDYTIAMRRLGEFPTDGCGAPGAVPQAPRRSVRDLFIDRAAFDAWAARYAQRLRAEGSVDGERRARMHAVNPKFVLRNHLAEQAIRRAQQGDFGETERLLKVLQRPFDEQPGHEADADFPPDWAQQLQVSCSS